MTVSLYTIKGVDQQTGQPLTIYVEADTEHDAATEAKRRGLLPTSVKPAKLSDEELNTRLAKTGLGKAEPMKERTVADRTGDIFLAVICGLFIIIGLFVTVWAVTERREGLVLLPSLWAIGLIIDHNIRHQNDSR